VVVLMLLFPLLLSLQGFVETDDDPLVLVAVFMLSTVLALPLPCELEVVGCSSRKFAGLQSPYTLPRT
jgi:hypothetical protein